MPRAVLSWSLVIALAGAQLFAARQGRDSAAVGFDVASVKVRTVGMSSTAAIASPDRFSRFNTLLGAGATGRRARVRHLHVDTDAPGGRGREHHDAALDQRYPAAFR